MMWLLLRIKVAIVSILSSPVRSQPGPQEKSSLISCCVFPLFKSLLSDLLLLQSLIEVSRVMSNTWGNSGPEAGKRPAVDSYFVMRPKC